MRNTYEFNIEYINKIKVDDGSLCVEYKRMDDPIEDKWFFIETFHSNLDYNENTGEFESICPRCGTWNNSTIQPILTTSDYECKSCDTTYHELYSEEDMIDIILSFMEEDTFNDITLSINDIIIK